MIPVTSKWVLYATFRQPESDITPNPTLLQILHYSKSYISIWYIYQNYGYCIINTIPHPPSPISHLPSQQWQHGPDTTGKAPTPDGSTPLRLRHGLGGLDIGMHLDLDLDLDLQMTGDLHPHHRHGAIGYVYTVVLILHRSVVAPAGMPTTLPSVPGRLVTSSTWSPVRACILLGVILSRTCEQTWTSSHPCRIPWLLTAAVRTRILTGCRRILSVRCASIS